MFKSESTMFLKRFLTAFKKIAITSSDDKGMQSINLIKTYVYGKSKDLVSDFLLTRSLLVP